MLKLRKRTENKQKISYSLDVVLWKKTQIFSIKYAYVFLYLYGDYINQKILNFTFIVYHYTVSEKVTQKKR